MQNVQFDQFSLVLPNISNKSIHPSLIKYFKLITSWLKHLVGVWFDYFSRALQKISHWSIQPSLTKYFPLIDSVELLRWWIHSSLTKVFPNRSIQSSLKMFWFDHLSVVLQKFRYNRFSRVLNNIQNWTIQTSLTKYFTKEESHKICEIDQL